jgi:hypothetical protein
LTHDWVASTSLAVARSNHRWRPLPIFILTWRMDSEFMPHDHEVPIVIFHIHFALHGFGQYLKVWFLGNFYGFWFIKEPEEIQRLQNRFLDFQKF